MLENKSFHIKVEISQVPTISKREVSIKKLEQNVIMPVNVSLAFGRWWSSDASIQIHNPSGNHGLCGRKSNNTKEETFCCLLTYIHSLMAVRLEVMALSFILTPHLHASMYLKSQ